MEQFGKLKLTQLNRVELETRQMNALKGGCEDRFCTCSCVSASVEDNRNANYNIGSYGGHSTEGDNNYWYDGYDGAYGDNAIIITYGV
jgi:natural product precursor